MNSLRHTGSYSVRAKLWQAQAHHSQEVDLRWQVAEEVAVGVLVNGHPVGVVMASPVNLKDLGIGFLLSEKHVSEAASIKSALLMRTRTGICVDVAVEPYALSTRPSRAMESRSSCGLCGLSALTDVTLELPFRPRRAPTAAAIARALGQLNEQQPMRAVNHSVHGAGYADFDGNLLLVREDVGRHNALDKLIGALARQRRGCTDGFAVMTSRCSFELVQKAATAGFAALATMSAPTQLALDTARAAGLPLASAAGDGVVLFAE